MASFYLNYRGRTIRAHKRRAEYFIVSSFPHLLLKCSGPTWFHPFPGCPLTYSTVLLFVKSFLFSDKRWVTLNTASQWGPAIILLEELGDFPRVLLSTLWHRTSLLHWHSNSYVCFIHLKVLQWTLTSLCVCRACISPSNPQWILLRLCGSSD